MLADTFVAVVLRPCKGPMNASRSSRSVVTWVTRRVAAAVGASGGLPGGFGGGLGRCSWCGNLDGRGADGSAVLDPGRRE